MSTGSGKSLQTANIVIANAEEFNPQIGGVPKVSSLLAESFISLGCKVFFVTCLKSIYSQNYKPAAEQIFLPCAFCYDAEENIETFKKFCVEKNIDVILNFSGSSFPFIRLCAETARPLNVPLISSVRMNPAFALSLIMDLKFTPVDRLSYFKAIKRVLVFPISYHRVRRKYNFLYKKLCLLSDRVVLLSNRYIEELEYFAGSCFSEKIAVIENPIRPEFLAEKIMKDKIVLFVGRLELYQKRPDRLLRIWEKIFEDYPDWKLKFAGDGPMRQKLEDYVKGRKIRNVEFLGFCDPVEHYRSASVLCMTSTMEGFGNVIMEGCSYGCIPIAFDSFKAVHDFIEDFKNGFIVKSFKMKSYENKLRMLMENPGLRKIMSEEAEKSSRNFASDNIISKWISLFRDLKIFPPHKAGAAG